MCGLTGFWDQRATMAADQLTRCVERMSDMLVARGPDDSGTWIDAACGMALGFRRLAIIDLTPTGHQPMVSTSGRFVLTFNGEVYNYRELAQDLALAGVSFRGSSDTEVILAGFEHWGVRATAERLNGMFAIVLWDRRERTLHLMRDRVGIKPLYWSRQGTLILWGSELKALRAHGGWTPTIEDRAKSSFLRHGYIAAPQTIYRGVYKLPPGTILTVKANQEPQIEPYWTLSDTARDGRANRLDVSDAEAINQLDALLRDAVGRCMLADVPLGAFLSGGIDSSTVVALMQAQSRTPVRTFTIGFQESDYNEAEHAKAIAQHLGTDHTEFYVEPAHALAVIPKLSQIYDEPFADSSQIPTYLLSQMTQGHVTVALSGDGGDELFAGYERYGQAEQMWKRTGWIPGPVRAAIAGGARSVPQTTWDRALNLAPPAVRSRVTGARLHRAADLLRDRAPDALYRQLMSQWSQPQDLMPATTEGATLHSDPAAVHLIPDFRERMRYVDTLTYLPDDVLTKVDRASMAVSLEARVPLLDHRVVAFAWRLPHGQLVRGGNTKWLLRQVLARYVPPALFERPKMGFGVPIGAWLRGPLREWAEDLLAEENLRDNGIEPSLVRTMWNDHLAGHRNAPYPLWTVLMLQDWQRNWKVG